MKSVVFDTSGDSEPHPTKSGYCWMEQLHVRCNLKFRNAGIQMVTDYGRSGYPIPNRTDLEKYWELGVRIQTARSPCCVLFIFELGRALNNLGVVCLPPPPSPNPSHTGARYPLIPQISASALNAFPISWLASLSLDCIWYITIKLKEGKLIIIVCRKYKHFN